MLNKADGKYSKVPINENSFLDILAYFLRSLNLFYHICLILKVKKLMENVKAYWNEDLIALEANSDKKSCYPFKLCKVFHHACLLGILVY